MIKQIYFILFILITYSFQVNLNNFKNKDILELKEEEKSDDIIILHTNDVHCAVNDNIGYDGLMLYKKELQRKYKNVLTVDAGDHIQGNIIGLLSKGIDIIRIMNKIGYNASTIGNHEFDYNIPALKNCSEKLTCGYICANFCYRKNKSKIFETSKIIPVGNKKLGFIGVVTPQTLTKTYLHSLTDDEGKLLYDFLAGNNSKDLYDELQKKIDSLKEIEKVDYIIILDHLGDESDTYTIYNSSRLISQLSGVNVMIDGHTHKIYNKTCKDKDGKDVILAQTGTKLSNIGVIKIKTNGEIISENINTVPEPEVKEGAEIVDRNGQKVWVDTEMKNFLITIENSHSEELNKKIGYTNFPFNVHTEPTKDYHKFTCRSEECTLGNLIADSMRYIGKSDIAFKNSGGIRNGLDEGDITYKDILNILPYSNEIVTKDISGQDILDALELGAKFLPEKAPKFIQVSGIKYDINIYINSTVVLDESEMFVKVNGKRRVSNVFIGNEKLDKKKIYKIAFDKFVADGGDGYTMFGKYEDYYSTSIVDNEGLMKYIKDYFNETIPVTYNQTEGRTNIYSKFVNEEEEDEGNDTISIISYISLGVSFIVIIVIIIYLITKKNSEISSDYGLSSMDETLF